MIDLSQLYMLEMMRKRRIAGGTADLGYSTDGLIMHLDAIKNKRLGGHSNTTTVWQDLSINQWDVDLYGHTWGADYCAFSGAEGSYGYSPYPATFDGNGTWEMVWLSSMPPVAYSGSGWVKSAIQTGRFGFVAGAKEGANWEMTLLKSRFDSSGEKRRYIGQNKTRRLYDGSIINVTSGIDSAQTTCGFYLATTEQQNTVEPVVTTYATQFCAIRVYNRNLSDAEMLAHLAIDTERFALV